MSFKNLFPSIVHARESNNTSFYIIFTPMEKDEKVK